MPDTPQSQDKMTTLKRAYLQLETLQAKLKAATGALKEPIAIVGMGCRFPGNANDADAFWDLLKNGVDAVTEIPPERWDVDAYYDPDPDAPGKMVTRRGAFLKEIDRFDPQLFGISPREAATMDPQQRLLMEVVWEALEDAGQAPDTLSGGRTGVFVGIIGSEYGQLQMAGDGILHVDTYFGSGAANSIASGRISYIFGLQGPSISIDTSCSSSLVAVHLACQSLRNRECKMALAGGVNLMLMPDATVILTKHRLMAPDGRCKTFDQAADGYVRGEGCGIVVLKRLADALTDGDRILALIKGTAANQDGPSSGLTAPHGPAQQAVIRMALENAEIKPADVGHVETHGTGTALGDPIEVQALSAVLREGRPSDRPVYLGAVKTNIGHLEAAAGVASLMKTVLVLRNREIPPHLNLKSPNPHIPWDRLPVTVARQRTPWPRSCPLVAGVSSFGFSGTNVHLILQAYEEEESKSSGSDRPRHLLGLSAHNENALTALVDRYRRHLDENPDGSLADICFSTNTGKAKHSHRLAVAADTLPQLRASLNSAFDDQSASGVVRGVCNSGEPPKVAFLFTGQGAQHVNMGRLLYDTQPVFRATVEECSAILASRHGYDLMWVLYPANSPQPAAGSLIHQTAYAQPALFAIESALLALWRSWGVKPTAVMGHSVGEYAAAFAAGIYNLEDGLRLICERARLMQSLPGGGQMAAIFADEARVAEALRRTGGGVAVAAVNGPEHVVVSGERDRVDQLIRFLDGQGVKSKQLNVSHAFHSPMVEPILDQFEKIAASVTFSDPRIHLISNVTGKTLTSSEAADPSYWRRHLRSPVSFHASIKTLYAMGYRIFLEIGPHPVLCGMAAYCLPDDDIAWLPSLRRDGNDWQEVLDSLGKLFLKGAQIDWAGFDGPYNRRRLPLPTYPFQRRRFWAETIRMQKTPRQLGKPVHPLLGYHLQSALSEIQFETSLSSDDFEFVHDHQVNGMTLLPATAFIEIASAAAKVAFGTEAIDLEDFIIHRPMIMDKGKVRVVQTIISPGQEDDYSLRICSRALGDEVAAEIAPVDESPWTVHVTGRIRKTPGDVERPTVSDSAVKTVLERCPEEISGTAHYEELSRRGFQFGPALQGVSFIRRGRKEALGRIRLSAAPGRSVDRFGFHPSLLDACLQFFWVILPNDSQSESYLPMSFERFRVYSEPHTELWSHIDYQPSLSEARGTIEGNVTIYDTAGKVVAVLERLAFRNSDKEVPLGVRPAALSDWFYQVEWKSGDRLASTQGEQTAGFGFAIEWMPTTEQIAAHVESKAPALQEAEDLASHHHFVNAVDELGCAYIIRALTTLGFQMNPGRRFFEEEAFRNSGIAGRYQRLFHRLLRIMAEAGLLRQTRDQWEVIRELPDDVTAQAQLDQLLAMPQAKTSAHLELVSRCGERLADVLTGKADPLALLFPDGSLSVASRLYSESPEAHVFNSLIREAVTKSLTDLPQGRKARIIELGAGTGGATSFVLPGLDPNRTEYVFTDISPIFLDRAAERFSAYPFVTYALCNIERGPEDQDFQTDSFDIVIAMNMIHATGDLKQSLRNIHKFLVPGGMLILLEGTAPERWIDVTFGLTDGWWAFTDTDLRSDYPLLSRETWCRAMTATGYVDACTAPSMTPLSPEALIIARKPAYTVEVKAGNHSAGGKWLILSDPGGLGAELAGHLKSMGHGCILVARGTDFIKHATDLWTIRFDHPEDFERLFRELGDDGDPNLRQIVHLDSMNGIISDSDTAAELEEAQTYVTRSLLFLLQAVLSNLGGERALKLSIVTKGAQAVDTSQAVSVAQAPAWGIGKVIWLEHPELNCRCIDLDPDASISDSVEHLVAELSAPNGEDQVALRGGSRLVPRLKLAEKPSQASRRGVACEQSQPLRLEKSATGILDELQLRPVALPEPGPGEVQIRVHTAGLSFHDVLNALGMRDDPDPLGSECSGKIVKIGKGVSGLAAGDAVIALATGSMGTMVNVKSAFVVRKPERISFEEAATIPTAFITAHYALHHLGSIRRGERVLIHAAAGGVGMAAVQIALTAGAKVFGTAGSDEKRAYLHSLGVKDVMDSRSLAFAEEVMAATGGTGVDLVLNSLAGDFITKSLSIVAAQGRFIEIGGREILTPAEARRTRPDVAYHIVDLAAGADENPELVHRLFSEVTESIAEGRLNPLPLKVFPLGDAASAFRYMSQGRHIGKIVIRNEQALESIPTIRDDACYLITGGLSGLGLCVVRWLAEQGAKHLAIMARSPADQTARDVLAELEQKGVTIQTFQADVSSRERVETCLGEISSQMPQLSGIVHCAGVLADGVLLNQTWEQFETVYAPKLCGAWNLHCATRDIKLDFFILFSSIAGLFGSVGQSNHAAANVFLDALAHHRKQGGLPALSINWGVWSEVGFAARKKADERMGQLGIGVITPQRGVEALEHVLKSNLAQIAVAPIEWPIFLEKFAGGRIPTLLSEMRGKAKPARPRRTPTKTRSNRETSNVLDTLKHLPVGKRRGALMNVVMSQTAKMLDLPTTADLDASKPLNEQGVDSLIAVELRNRLGKELGMQKGLPATLVFDYPTITALTDFLFRRTPFWTEEKGNEGPGEVEKSDDLVGAIENLSEEEVDRLLRQGQEAEG